MLVCATYQVNLHIHQLFLEEKNSNIHLKHLQMGNNNLDLMDNLKAQYMCGLKEFSH